jgi:P pilus assembly chaperone PapD
MKFISIKAALLAATLLLAHGAALAQLMLFPTRIVFEPGQRVAQLQLINDGQEPATYRIEMINRRMTEAGQIVDIDTPQPGELFSAPMVRYSPHQVTLQPGASQTLRFSLRRPADLAAGEYRSHLAFRRVADASGSTSAEQTQAPGSGDIGTALTVLIGASIPVIVREGQLSVTAELSGLALVKSPAGPELLVDAMLARSGNRSVYGDLILLWTPQGGKPEEIANVGGVAVYVPNPRRKVRITPKVKVNFKQGTLRLEYRERKDAGGALLAQTELVVP